MSTAPRPHDPPRSQPARRHPARGPLCAGIDPHAGLLHGWGLDDESPASSASPGARWGARPRRRGQAAVGVLRTLRSRGVAVLERVVELPAPPARWPPRRQARRHRLHLAGVRRRVPRPVVAAGLDAITVSPYLGFGSLDPMVDTARRHGARPLRARPDLQQGGPGGAARATAAGGTVAGRVLARLRDLNAGPTPLGSFGAVSARPSVRPPSDLDIGGPLLAPGYGARAAASTTCAGSRRAAGHVLPSSSREGHRDGPDPRGSRRRGRRDDNQGPGCGVGGRVGPAAAAGVRRRPWPAAAADGLRRRPAGGVLCAAVRAAPEGARGGSSAAAGERAGSLLRRRHASLAQQGALRHQRRVAAGRHPHPGPRPGGARRRRHPREHRTAAPRPTASRGREGAIDGAARELGSRSTLDALPASTSRRVTCVAARSASEPGSHGERSPDCRCARELTRLAPVAGRGRPPANSKDLRTWLCPRSPPNSARRPSKGRGLPPGTGRGEEPPQELRRLDLGRAPRGPANEVIGKMRVVDLLSRCPASARSAPGS